MFLRVGTELSSSHSPGTGVGVKTEAWQGLLKKCLPTSAQSFRRGLRLSGSFPLPDQVRGWRVEKDRLQFPPIWPVGENSRKATLANETHLKCFHLVLFLLQVPICLTLIFLSCSCPTLLLSAHWFITSLWSVTWYRDRQPGGWVMWHQAQAVAPVWSGLRRASYSKNLFGAGNTLTHKELFLHSLFFWL